MAKADFLKEEAEAFLEDAEYNISKEKWFLAAFHLEQACQLYLKYYLYLKLRRYPKTHSLRELLEGLGKAYDKKKVVGKILKEKANVIGDLDQAYLTSRYLPVEFGKHQVEGMLKFTKELIKLLKRL